MIVAVLIVGLALLLVSMNKDAFSKNTALSVKAVPWANLIDSCFNSAFEYDVALIGIQGGKIYSDGYYIEDNASRIYIWYYNGTKAVPSLTETETEMEKSIESMVSICLDPKYYPEQNISLKSKPTVNVEIDEKGIRGELSYSLSVTDKEETYLVAQRIKKSSNASFFEFRKISAEIVDSIAETGSIDFGPIENTSAQVTLINSANDLIIFNIEDYDAETNESSYIFRFGADF